MACCGQNRSNFASNPQSLATAGEVSASTSLRFVQRRSIAVRGPVTGKHYQFHNAAYTHGIDPRDSAVLLKSGHFEPMTQS